MKKTIQIVLDTDGWILEALAKKCYQELRKSGEKYETTLKVGLGDPGYDIYIHFIYLSAQIVPNSINIMYVTHIDRYHKAFRLLRLSRKNAFSVTMSTSTKKLVERYTGLKNTIVQIPESLHFKSVNNNKKITFGIFSNLYPDKRKNDQAISDFISLADQFHPHIHAIIMGSGFSDILKQHTSLSYEYYNDEFNVKNYKKNLNRCDYILYFGKDEGAISILDAATLDIPIIAIAQGYHKDIHLPKYSKLCSSSEEMLQTIKNICTSNSKDTDYLEWGELLDIILKGKNIKKPSFFRYFFIPFVKNEFSIESQVNIAKIKKIITAD